MSIYIIVATKTEKKHSYKKSVHLEGGKTSNGTKIVLGDWVEPYHEDYDNQLWVWNGTLFINFKNPIKCLHLTGGTSNGTLIHLYDIISKSHPDHLNQEWRLEGRNIVSRKSASACWHIKGNGTDNGTKIQLWNEKNHENGSWRMVNTNGYQRNHFTDLSFLGSSWFRIVPSKSLEKTVQLVGGSTRSGTQIELSDKVPIGHKYFESQLWRYDGRALISAKDESKSLHLDGGKTENGTKIVLWDSPGSPHPNQIWYAARNIVSLKNRSACWHLENGDTGNGTKIVIRNEKNHENGEWRKEYLYDKKVVVVYEDDQKL